MTNLGSLKPGDPVNLEADLIAKYVEKMMKGEATQTAFTVEELVTARLLAASAVLSLAISKRPILHLLHLDTGC